MGALTDRITNFEFYKELFSTWEATEQIIDKDKAFWMLRKPDSQYEKICLYRDGKNMFVYGDYGNFTFDSMTWIGTVHNLEYDNIGYQMEKLSYDSKESLMVFDDTECKKDIIDWLKDVIERKYNYIQEEDIEKVINFVSGKNYDFLYLDDFIEKTGYDDLHDILEFINDLFINCDEYDYIAFLRQNTNTLELFDEVCESSLWKAGMIIHQRYFINMYALQVCSEKLKEI